jgi:hypothetical protein
VTSGRGLPVASARAEQSAGQRVVLAVHLGQRFGESSAAQHRRTFPGAQ